jgi:hypothetical protein
MKYLFFLMMMIGPIANLHAQETPVLPKDETGRYIYYEVVQHAKPTDSLKAKLKDFLSKNKKEIKFKAAEDQAVSAQGKIVINKSLAMLSHPSGEIVYQFQFELSAGKYRFWLTDFQFFPYQKDRYGNFVPSTSIGIPLEQSPKKSNEAQWSDYLLQASRYATTFAKRLKNHLAGEPALPVVTKEQKVVKKEC